MKKIIFGLVATSAFVFAYGDLKALEKECENGVAKSCLATGDTYKLPTGDTYKTKQNYEKALKYYTKGCEAKEDSEDKFNSCSQAGNIYIFGQGGVEENPKKAVELYKKACDGKDSLGCRGLAGAYYFGIGVKQDITKAAAISINICDENNDVTSCNMFATIIENSDKQKALIYYKKACDIGKNKTYVQQDQDAQKIWQEACNKYKTLK
ncbi:tetratricopeptide repeat protein [Campylobacter gastrosuis]|uniref:beta-lactamase n=1 Tax=Campylobacter gastrosuis TaxID=2974576 RepID=A0ABT7HQW9_9BACT|nr:tetratricopeptide repeat protein [Campylobacter gastrosuis]MDL0089322.1 sel1 repeat family protein [Campylobacter gastrosuis]